MTLTEAQNLRTVMLAAITALASGGIASYTVNGRMVTKIDLSKLMGELNDLDTLIDRLQNGQFSPVRFRGPW